MSYINAPDQLARSSSKSQLSKLEDTAKYVLRTVPDRGGARKELARQLDQHVFASSIDGHTITWSIALVGQGGFGTSYSSTVTGLRSCLQLRSAAALELSRTTVTCPAKFTNSPDFETTDREIDLLKK